MAINNLANYKQADGFGMSLNIRRGNPNPLDNSELYSSLTAAQNYAKNDATAYVGQTIKVIENNTVTTYVIKNAAGDLEKVAFDAELKSYADDAAAAAQTAAEKTAASDATTKANKALEDAKQHATELDMNMNQRVESVEGDVDTLKTQIGGLTGAMHFVGKKDTVPADGAEGYASGDVVLVGTLEYVYDGAKWHVLGDEGSYLTKTEASNTYLAKSDAANTYLAKADANSTYETKANAGNKLDAAKQYAEECAEDSAQYAQQKAKEYTDAEIATLKTYLENEDTGLQDSIDEVAGAVAELEANGVFVKGDGEGSIEGNFGGAQATSKGAVAIGTEMVKSIAALNDVQNTVAGSKAFRYIGRKDENGGTTFVIEGNFAEEFSAGQLCYVITNSDYADKPVASVTYNAESDTTSVNFTGTFKADPVEGWDKDAPYKKTIQIVGRPELGNVDLGMYSFAQGLGNQAIGYASVAMGRRNVVESAYGVAFGRNNKARFAAFAEGNGNEALGDASHAEGNSTHATGNYAHSEGNATKATKGSAHAEGFETEANGEASHAQGAQTKAQADYSDASGWGTIANAKAQSVVGRFNIADSNAMFIVGTGANDSDRKNAFTVTNNSNVIVGPNSIDPAKKGSVAEGEGTYVGADYAHAAGYKTQAVSKYSFAAGEGTKTWANRQMAVGHYNAREDAAYFIVGNGTSDEARSNVFTVRSDAAYMNGSKVVNETKLNGEVNTLNQIIIEKEGALNKTIADNKTALEQAITDGDATLSQELNNAVSAINETIEGIDKEVADVANEVSAHAVLNKGTGINSIVQPINPDSTIYTVPNVAKKEGAVAFGMASQATGIGAFAQGHRSIAAGNFAHAEGDIDYESASYLEYLGVMPELSGLTVKSGAYGQASHTEGRNTVAVGDFSHAQNEGTVAYGLYSHAQNYCTKAMGISSTAMGEDTRAQGLASTATGSRTEANADYSSAHGLSTRATDAAQFVVGKYNSTESTAQFIVGVGKALGDNNTARDNCFTTGLKGDGTKYIKVGNVELTEAQLKKVLDFIATVNIQTGREIKTFSINLYDYTPTTYEFEEGMTWGDWVNSEYNIDTAYTVNESTNEINLGSWMVYDNNSDDYWVHKDDVIVAERQYGMSE